MSPSPDGPQKPLIAHDIDAWMRSAQEQRAKLHLQAAGPWNSDERYAAFARMSELLLDAFEEMRLVSAALREDSTTIRSHAAGLVEKSAALCARSTSAANCRPWFAPPPSEELHRAESQMLDMFKGEAHRDEQS